MLKRTVPVVLGGLCLAGILLLLQYVDRKITQSAFVTIQNLFIKTTDLLNKELEEDRAILSTAGFALAGADPGEARRILEELLMGRHYLGAAYESPAGRLVVGDDPPASGPRGFGLPEVNSLGQWQVAYTVPVERNGQKQGTLHALIPIRHYNRHGLMRIHDRGDGKAGYACLIDIRSRQIILSPSTPNLSWGYILDADRLFRAIGCQPGAIPDLYRKMREETSFTLRTTVDGEPNYASFLPLRENPDWYFCGLIPINDVHQEYTIVMRILGLVFALLLVLAALLVAGGFAFMRRRAREQVQRYLEHEYKNTTYDALALSSDTVVCLFDRGRHALEQVFQNCERIMGASARAYLDDPSLFRALCDAAHPDLHRRLMNDEITGPEVYELSLAHAATGESVHIRFAIKESVVADKPKYLFFWEDRTADVQARESLRRAIDLAEEASRHKSVFLSQMSHEIRTPLNVVLGMITIAERNLEKPARLADCIAKVRGAASHLLHLINDILDMAKIENGKLRLMPEPCDLAQLIGDVTELAWVQAASKRQHFAIVIDAVRHEALLADATRLRQILLNLLSNAVKYTDEGGSVRLSIREIPAARSDRAAFCFAVEDNGVGMSPAFLEKIGQPFEQEANLSHNKEASTGLGLAIVRNLTDLMGGSIDITSEQGKGTTVAVTLEFPLTETFTAEVGAVRGLSVLVVDGDDAVRKDALRALAETGIAADEARDGDSALEKARRTCGEGRPFAAAFVTWELAPALRRELDRVSPGTALFVTAYSSSQMRDDDFDIRRFVPKPLFLSRMLQALWTLREEPGSAAMRLVPAPATDLRGKRVLLAEDNALNREIAVELLGGLGLSVDTACDGKEAFETFAASAPSFYQAVILDVQMPVWDGLRAARAIRACAHPDAGSVPLLAMTANTFAEDVEACRAAGMDAHIAKPIHVPKLYAILRAYLDAHNARSSA